MFPSLPAARSFAERHFKHGYLGVTSYLSSCGTYSGTCEPGGRGAGAYCTVIKTDEWWRSHWSDERQAQLALELQAAIGRRRAVAQA